MTNAPDRPAITPDMKVADLLEAYPELEETLVALAEPFRKLRNPVLRRTVARVTTLSQAARVGGLSLGVMINALRREAGQAETVLPERPEAASAESASEGAIAETIDARPLLERGEHPVGMVLSKLEALPPGCGLKLITPFVPAPLIDRARDRGVPASTTQRSAEEFETVFRRT